MAKKKSFFSRNNQSGAQLVPATIAETEPIMLNYNYDEVKQDIRESVKSSVRRAKVHGRTINESFGKIGEELIKLKEALPHGQFADVIHSEFEMSTRQAQRMMSVSREYAEKPQMLEVFSGSALAMLASPSTPDEVKAAAEVAAENGEAWSKAETREKIKEAKAPVIVIEDEDLAAAQSSGFRIEPPTREERIENNSQHPTFVAPEPIIETDVEAAEDAGIKWKPSAMQGEITSRMSGKSMEHKVVLEAPDGTLMRTTILISETHVVTMAGYKYAEDE